MDRKTIDEFEVAGAKLRRVIAGLGKEHLLWVPPPARESGDGRFSRSFCI